MLKIEKDLTVTDNGKIVADVVPRGPFSSMVFGSSNLPDSSALIEDVEYLKSRLSYERETRDRLKQQISHATEAVGDPSAKLHKIQELLKLW